MKKNKEILKMFRYICLVCIIFFGLMTIVGTGGGDSDSDEDNALNGDGEADAMDYSGTYYVNLASQPRWIMTIVQSGTYVTFTLEGTYLIEGDGTVTDDAMTLTSDFNGFVDIFIIFSEDGQSFSGTWEHITSSGTITGTKTPWVTYNVDLNGIPKFVSTDVIELEKISDISKFRSGAGHDYSDDFESCRSMKHYFIPEEGIPRDSVQIFSPISGTVIGTTDEWSEGSVWKGTMVGVESNDYPSFHVIIFHINLTTPLNVGDEIVAGQFLGYPPDYENVTIADTAVGVVTPGGYKLVSYFEVMTDSLFQSYKDRGVSARADIIISEAERDADPLSCVGETFEDEGSLENWVYLN